jgi:hypothetical protein
MNISAADIASFNQQPYSAVSLTTVIYVHVLINCATEWRHKTSCDVTTRHSCNSPHAHSKDWR